MSVVYPAVDKGVLFSTASRVTTSGPDRSVERRVGVIRLMDVKESQP